MSQTFTYKFVDAATGAVDHLAVTTSTSTSDALGFGPAYAVTGITGMVNGAVVTGPVGNSDMVQTSANGGAIFDNDIFISSASGGVYGGDSGSDAGIDVYGLEFNVGGVEYNLFNANGTFELFATNDTSDIDTLNLKKTTAPCFYAGSNIQTPSGEVAVENLKVGDLVQTCSGEAKPVRWLGKSTVSTRFADPLRVLPIRIKAGALGDNVPARDLLVSPDHAMFVGNLLVQAGTMVNGRSIVRERNVPETFAYYHIELAGHELILAEGAPTESFVDNVDRMNFDNWEEHQALAIAEMIPEMDYPRVKAFRQLPASIRNLLDSRAASYVESLAA